MQVVLGLGSNMGESQSILQHAVCDLSDILDKILVSSLYRTKPQDFEEQPDFYNMVVIGYFSGKPAELLAKVQRIENKYGRDRKTEIKKGPRLLDIDIELFGNLNINKSDLVIPHAGLYNRQFVLIPLMEINDGIIDPVSGRLFRDILSLLPDQGVKKAGNIYGN